MSDGVSQKIPEHRRQHFVRLYRDLWKFAYDLEVRVGMCFLDCSEFRVYLITYVDWLQFCSTITCERLDKIACRVG